VVRTRRLVEASSGWAFAVALLLLGFFALTGSRVAGGAWFERGSASAERILHGEVWRTITALTLHADLAHVLGNAIACVVLIPPVAQALGPGTGLLVLLASGAIGNALTALVLGAPHNSVGASTVTFAAFGVLTARAILAMARRDDVAAAVGRRRSGRLIAGHARDGRGADVLAHVFGLLVGAVVGLSVSVVRPRPFRGPVSGCSWSGVAVVLTCWWIA
jgi:membrane associated rhomboid family serine protease